MIDISRIPPPELERIIQDAIEDVGMVEDSVRDAISDAIKKCGKPKSDGCYDDLILKWFPLDDDAGEESTKAVFAERKKFKDRVEQCLTRYWDNHIEDGLAVDLTHPMHTELEIALEKSSGSPASLADTIWDWIRERMK